MKMMNFTMIDDESYELDLHKENYEPDIKNALPDIPHA
jgi:hypothetical protein